MQHYPIDPYTSGMHSLGILKDKRQLFSHNHLFNAKKHKQLKLKLDLHTSESKILKLKPRSRVTKHRDPNDRKNRVLGKKL